MKIIYTLFAIVAMAITMSVSMAAPTISAEAGFLVGGSFEGKQAYGQILVEKEFYPGLSLGAGIMHKNNIGAAKVGVEDLSVDEGTFNPNDRTIVLNNIGSITNSNGPMVQARYVKPIKGNLNALGVAKHTFDETVTDVGAGITYQLSNDLSVQAVYSKSWADDSNMEVDGVGLSLRATY